MGRIGGGCDVMTPKAPPHPPLITRVMSMNRERFQEARKGIEHVGSSENHKSTNFLIFPKVTNLINEITAFSAFLSLVENGSPDPRRLQTR